MRKTVSNGGVGKDSGLNGITDFYYDGWRVIEEREPDLQAGTDVTVRQMTYGNYLDEVWTVDARRDGSGGAVSVAMLNDGALGAGGGGGESHRVFCHANTLYHVCGVTDETGALREAFQYEPYGGHTRIADGPDADLLVNFGADDVRTAGARSAFGVAASFTGQRFDPETGLHYYKNRYYSARLGRFVSRDPMGDYHDRLGNGNGYAFVGNRPIVYSDALGFAGGCPPDEDCNRCPPGNYPIDGKNCNCSEDEGLVCNPTSGECYCQKKPVPRTEPGDKEKRDLIKCGLKARKTTERAGACETRANRTCQSIQRCMMDLGYTHLTYCSLSIRKYFYGAVHFCCAVTCFGQTLDAFDLGYWPCAGVVIADDPYVERRQGGEPVFPQPRM